MLNLAKEYLDCSFKEALVYIYQSFIDHPQIQVNNNHIESVQTISTMYVTDDRSKFELQKKSLKLIIELTLNHPVLLNSWLDVASRSLLYPNFLTDTVLLNIIQFKELDIYLAISK